MTVLDKITKFLNEMPIPVRKLHSGMMKNRAEIDNVKTIQKGGDTLQVGNDQYKAVKKVNGDALSAGMIVLGSYNKYNQGADLYEVLGFTADDQEYGDGGVKFKSAKELLVHYRVKTLKELMALQDKNKYGYSSYLVVKDIEDGSSGPWFYLNNGRWARGSGAEALSFTLMKKV